MQALAHQNEIKIKLFVVGTNNKGLYRSYQNPTLNRTLIGNNFFMLVHCSFGCLATCIFTVPYFYRIDSLRLTVNTKMP